MGAMYRGTVASAGSAEDLATLQDAMPVWLLEYLLLGGAPQVAIIKIQFALLPGEEQLLELVNPQSFLRVESCGHSRPGHAARVSPPIHGRPQRAIVPDDPRTRHT